ncbi:MAG: YebC/PmpR family DNA-binding transcriptional regulator [Microbacteriaceae bacterium]
MAGHSKWATTKHKKAILDSRRAKSFAKLIKVIEVAAKSGGPDVEGNPALALALSKAKKASVPNENIDRAVKRGAGLTGESIEYFEIMYEGYGQGGIAIMIECLTDNKNRAAAEVRIAMTRNGGQMADPGSVAYNFTRKGVVSIQKSDAITEDDILAAVLEAGVEEVIDQGGGFEVLSEPSDLVSISDALDAAGIEYDSAEAEFVAGVHIEPDLETARKILKLVDALEDVDDVQNVYTNFTLTPEVEAALEEE